MSVSVVLAGLINAPLGMVSEQGVGVNAQAAQTIVLVDRFVVGYSSFVSST